MEALNLNIFNTLILVGVIHGIIFGVVILVNEKFKSRTNFYLALTVFSLTLSNLQYWLKDVYIYLHSDIVPFFPFEFLMLPFFYFFVKSYLNKTTNRFEIIALLSFFPLFIIYQYIFNENIFSTKTIASTNLIVEYLSIIYSIFSIIMTYKIILTYEKTNTEDIPIATKWLKQLLIAGLFLCLIWFLSFNLIDALFSSGYYRFYPLWIGISILIYWIGYTSILQKDILSQRQLIRLKNNGSNIQDKFNSNNTNAIHQKSKALKKPESFLKFENVIINKQLYLNPDLKLIDIADILNISRGYLSQLISKESDLNFNDYINSLRVNAAKDMLSNKDYDNYTIVAIGLESGFKSKSSFFTAFKKFTGTSPSNFKKEVRNM
ncbi:MAG: AraC family transcriptional regulator [Winogradskyella sp.]|uniref:helix-turn-helix domain-containing protein n=1 Tax=Winogradskyella sp. TaxID=1883156 RepID=UPI000F3CB1B8|nr:helix-turn-helix domain-containing protein [Winogradskyella sp.]RNC84873.1 MAG: AraC family transcriptional regulator [Winogradskyella sp.]